MARWAHFYPEAEIVEAPDDGLDPFNKSMAVNAAAAKASGDILAILDADSWVDENHVRRALTMIEEGVAPWVIPCRTAWRLRPEISQTIMALPPGAKWPLMRPMDAEQRGPVCGFLHLVTHKGFDMVGGYDERIRGWGGEDTAFTRAMDLVVGRHRKLNGMVYSLWHDRPRDANGNGSGWGRTGPPRHTSGKWSAPTTRRGVGRPCWRW